MSYSEKVLDHYNEPRNVGSLDKDDPNVGTGLVGAPECFGGRTLVAVPDRKHISLEEAFEENKVFPVWSFNMKEGKFEIKNARAICSGRKLMHSIKINNSVIWVTPDHEFYTIENGYVKNSEIGPSVSIRSFIGQNDRMEIIGETKEDLCYTLQVEENNNYVVITDIRLNNESGIVVRNCGDVMKLQIKVNGEGVIEDAVFKSYGCGSAIASSSLATEWVRGKTLEEAESISNVDIVDELSLPPVKIHCSVLAEDSIKAAIADYRKKQESQLIDGVSDSVASDLDVYESKPE